jgi:succinylarginine dihydrolase
MEPTRTIAVAATTTWTTSTATCTTAVPGKYGAVPVDACNSNYGFHPSFETNVAFAVLFGCSMIAHFIQAFVWKKVRSAPQY